MPDIVAELTRCQDNEIIDHLRWHIAQGRTPTSLEADSAQSVVVLGFAGGEQWRHEITPESFADYWRDARAVVAALPELPQMAEFRSHDANG